MKKLLISLTAASAIAAAAPAAAQYGSQPYGSQPYGAQANVNANVQLNLRNRIAQLGQRLEAGITAGTIDRNEARSLRQQVRQLQRVESQYARGGLTQRERQDLQQRIRAVRQQLRVADGGNPNRYADWDNDNFGYDQGYGNQGYNQGYGNQGYNQGYGNQGYGQGYGQGRYREVGEVCGQRAGLGAVLGAILGADNCLRVGERVTSTAGLSGLPGQLSDQFRDRSGYTYRYLEGNVVEIDTRTSVVTRIYNVG